MSFRTVTLLPRLTSKLTRHRESEQCRLKSTVSCSLKSDDEIAVLTLDNPSKLNALDVDMGDALTTHVEALKQTSSLRAVVVTGAGKAFSAGGDLEFLMARHNDTKDNNVQTMIAFYRRFLCLRDLPVPVIGAINGPAIGAGFSLALGGCDFRVASTKAKMGLTFVQLGLHPGMGSSHFLPLISGSQVAGDLLLTGRVFSAAEAQTMGLVSRVTDDALSGAFELASIVSAAGPLAVAECLRTLRDRQNVGLEEALAREAEAQALNYASKDLAEGVRALQEKRKPVFKGV